MFFWDKEKFLNFLYEFLFIEFGVFAVYILTKFSSFNSVFAVSTTMLIVGILFPKFSIVFLCGGFISVMNPETFNNPGFLLFSGFISYIIYYFTQNLVLGLGGRPGTIAFLANLITFLLVYLISLGKSFKYFPMDYVIDYSYFEKLNIYIYIFGPSICVLGTILVYFLAEYLKSVIAITHRTVAYGVICMFGCMYFLTLTMEYRVITYTNTTNIKISYGQMFINFWHIGTLSGLTIKTKYRQDGQNAIFHYIVSSLISSLIGLGFMGVLIFGGKHGISAFLGNILYVNFLNRMFPLQEKLPTKQAEVLNQVNNINNNNIYEEVEKGNYPINNIQYNKNYQKGYKQTSNQIISKFERIGNDCNEEIRINEKEKEAPYEDYVLKKDNKTFNSKSQQVYENGVKKKILKNEDHYYIESFFIEL